MRVVTPIEKIIFEEEAEEIGGMVVLIVGEPGAGKTRGLVKLVTLDLKNDRIPLWTGQKSCQWIINAAQGHPVTLWIHDTIKSHEFYTTGSLKDDIPEQKVNLRDKDSLDIKKKTFSEPKELVENIDVGRVNVYFIPGSNGGEAENYFFQKKNLELAKALNNRGYGDHVTWNADEIQNIAPDKKKRPFFDLQMNMFPKQWEDFRKNNVSKRGTAHGYAELNWKYYDLKANGIAYMQGGKVHSNHTQIDQGKVNNMRRGQFVVNGFEAGEFDPMPKDPAEAFDWLRDHKDVELKMRWEAEIPDIRPEPEDVESVLEELPIEVSDLRGLWTPSEYAEEAGITTRAVQKKLATNKLPGIKLGGKWLLSEEQIINSENLPS